MGAPYLGEVKLVGFNFPPKGWAFCNGQVLSIQQNAALFSILGTTYGGNGVTTFALPNLQGRVPVHTGGPSNIVLGQVAGSAAVTLTSNQAGHGHLVKATASATTNTAGGNFPATAPGNIYGAAAPDTAMNAGVITPQGGSQPHNNLQPYLVVTYCIALVGIFPSRN
jgi:microcystin-dependent protein